jgi:hypothetical protein
MSAGIERTRVNVALMILAAVLSITAVQHAVALIPLGPALQERP